MSESYFGATRTNLFSGHEAFSVAISRIKCSLCPIQSNAQYTVWATSDASDAERREALLLLAALIKRDHPAHSLVGYGGMTLEALRRQVWPRARGAASS